MDVGTLAAIIALETESQRKYNTGSSDAGKRHVKRFKLVPQASLEALSL